MSPAKLRLVLAFALAFSLLTLFEVVTQREDWPLSCYPMYSKLVRHRVVTRAVLVGVSEQGEFALMDDQTSPYSGARLLSLSRQLAKQPARARQFVRVLGARYERKRLREQWPVLQAVRSYSEKWVARPGLAGIEKPARSLDQAMYVPPPALLERLQAEEAGHAAPLRPVSAPPGDRVVELDAASCDDGCSPAADPQASGGSALSLEGGNRAGSITTRLRLERGRYAFLFRMKVRSIANFDRVFLELDGRRVATSAGLGNYLEALPYAGWLWASQRPGVTPLVLDVETDGEHALTLSTGSKVLVDQLWLSRSVRELPVDNAARQP